MIQPRELQETRPIALHDGASATTTQVWDMLCASHDGDLKRVQDLVEQTPGLLTCQFDYTAPLHFAVREGHLDLVRYLVNRGALDPGYKTHPYMDALVTVAEDHHHNEIAQLLRQTISEGTLTREWGDAGGIDFGRDDAHSRFQHAVNKGQAGEVEAMLKENPELAKDDLAFWGEGILAMPANHADRQMLELLLSYGARVPDVSKWAYAYYFKHYEIAAFLLENGMNPNHMSWRCVTLLQDRAYNGDIDKVRLLLDHGADVNAIDEEYRSTALGFAVRWGQKDAVALLIERGVDVNKAGAAWATPLAWARSRGLTDIEAALLNAGAS